MTIETSRLVTIEQADIASLTDAALQIEDVLREHGAMLLRMAAAYASKQSQRDDLAQEMSVAIWKALPAWRGEGDLKAFVARVAQYAALDRLRREPKADFVALQEDADIESSQPLPEQHTGDAQRREHLAAALRCLPTGQRECVLLALEGFGNSEIAENLGLSPNTVDQRLSRARTQLRAYLEKRHHV